jgi:hypothetical protein
MSGTTTPKSVLSKLVKAVRLAAVDVLAKPDPPTLSNESATAILDAKAAWDEHRDAKVLGEE